MSEWLCESCKHRNGKLRVYHRIDSLGIERSYKNVVKVACSSSAKYPNMVKDAVRCDPFIDPQFTCLDFTKRRGK